MRRLLALACAAAAVLGAGVIAAQPIAAAPPSSLLLVAKSRDGQHARAIARAVNESTGRTYSLHGSREGRLPAGTYAVIVQIDGTPDQTFGARQIRVSGRTVATFRARQGRLIRARLRPQPPAGYEQEFNVAVCVPGRGAYLVGGGSPGNVYVIPSRLSAVAMSFGSTWTSYNEGPAPPYFGGGAVRHGLPSGINRSFHRPALARVELAARRGPVAGSGLIELQGRSGGCGGGGVFEVGVTRSLPTRFTAYVTPGSWQAEELMNDGVIGRSHNYHAGHSYRVTMDRAA